MKKRNFSNPELEDQSAGWQITYSSLSLILVVVFVMLVSYSIVDKGKMERLKETVKERATVIGRPDNSQKNDELAKPEGDKTGAWAAEAIRSLTNIGDSFGIKKDFAVQRYKTGIRLKFNSDIIYPSGSAEIKTEIYPILDEIYKVAVKQHLYLRVAGHTDDVPISSEEFPSNWELSTKRAANIVRYLLEEKGMPADRLFAEGFGQYQPLVQSADPEAKKRNRRIEVYIEPSPGGCSRGGKDHRVQKNI